MKMIIMLFVLGCWQTAHSAANSGGTVVGNGAGSVESNFQHAYHSLSKIISNCSASQKCGTAEEENKILISIQKIVLKNANKKDRLVFLSEKLNPGFFTTGTDQTNRIAKTFLNSDSPIYINTDMLYEADGKVALNFQGILRILIHELGHQTGLEDHASLDMLGVKVSSFSEDRTYHYSYKLENDNKNISFAVTNLEYPVKSTLVLFNWKDKKVIDLSDTILSSTSCTYDSESFEGAQITNGHFDIDSQGLLSFQAWLNYSCFERFSDQIIVYRKDINITLDNEFHIIGLRVK